MKKVNFDAFDAQALELEETTQVKGGTGGPCFGSYKVVGDWVNNGCTYEDQEDCSTGDVACDVPVD